MAVEEAWSCYMVQCRDGALYVGIATDVAERVKRHNWGVGARHTSLRRPVRLVWSEEHHDEKAARAREAELKGWRRAKKLELVARRLNEIHPSP